MPSENRHLAGSGVGCLAGLKLFRCSCTRRLAHDSFQVSLGARLAASRMALIVLASTYALYLSETRTGAFSEGLSWCRSNIPSAMVASLGLSLLVLLTASTWPRVDES